MWIAPERRGVGRWIIPGLVLAAGVAVAAALAADGRLDSGLLAGGVLAGYAVLLGARRNESSLPFSESYGGGHRARTHRRAAALTGDVLTVTLVGAVVVQALRGAEVLPYAWPVAVAGGVYALAALFGGRGL